MRGIVEFIEERDNGRWVVKVEGQTVGIFPDTNKKPTPGFDLLSGIRKGDEVEIETKKSGKWTNGVSIKKLSVTKRPPGTANGYQGPRTTREEQRFINRRCALEKATQIAAAKLSCVPADTTMPTIGKMAEEVRTVALDFYEWLEAVEAPNGTVSQ